MTLQEGVGRAAPDFCGSNHKTFAKLVNVLSVAPQPRVWTNLLRCSGVTGGILSNSMSFPGKIVLLPAWHFNLFHSSPFDIPAAGLFHQVAAMPWEQLWCWKQADCLEKWKEVISTFPEQISSKNPEESSVSSADWNSSPDTPGTEQH